MKSLIHSLIVSCRRNALVAACLTAALLCTAAFPASGVAYTWSGNGADSNWSTGANWVGGGAPASNSVTYSMVFLSSTRTNPTITTSYNVANLIFGAGASSYTVSGSSLAIGLWSGTGIINNSASTQTFNTGLNLAVSQTWLAASGNLVISNTGVSLAANTLTIDGSNNTTFTTNGGGLVGTGGL